MDIVLRFRLVRLMKARRAQWTENLIPDNIPINQCDCGDGSMPAGRPYALNNNKSQFVGKLNKNLKSFNKLRPMTVNHGGNLRSSPIHPSEATKFVELCFMANLIAWEDFVETVFIKYMLGSSSPNGSYPTKKLGPFQTQEHAYQVLSGNTVFKVGKDFLSWTDLKLIQSRAKLFFDRGHPFTGIIDQYRDRLSDGFKLRNRVAHSSASCAMKFKEVSNRFQGVPGGSKLPRGLTVGKLLVNYQVRGFGSFDNQTCYFLAYDKMLRHMADQIAP